MLNLKNLENVKALKQNMHATFDSAAGQEVMAYLEQICRWYPNIADSNDTNDIIARDAYRHVLGTIKTFLNLSPQQIHELATTGTMDAM